MPFGDISLLHVPNMAAVSVLCTMLVYAFGLGALLLDIVAHLWFDGRLLCDPGWSDPLKAVNRLAYFICRYGALTNMLLTIVYMNLPGLACKPFLDVSRVIWCTALLACDFIFLLRTLALYGWSCKLTVAVSTLFISYAVVSYYLVLKSGFGMRVPGSTFCSFQPRDNHAQPLWALYLVHSIVSFSLDTAILVLTCVRLGGRPRHVGTASMRRFLTYWRDSKRDTTSTNDFGAHTTSLSSDLIRQGVLLYGCQVANRLAFIVVHYCVDYRSSYQLMICGLVITLDSITAGALLRQTSAAVRHTKHSQQSQ